MRIYKSFDEAGYVRNAVVTTGTFDGVHVGHKAIINRLNRLANEVQGESVLVTFHPHPRKVLYPDSEGRNLRLILTQEEKIEHLRETGLQNLLIVPFTLDFSRITSHEFVTGYLLGKLHAKVIVVGYNHHFGHNREGDYSYLYELSKSLGFAVEEIPMQEIQNESVSSTKIRKALQEGNIQRANAYLDHLFCISGIASEGNPFLHAKGFPTSFLAISDPEKLIPPEGVYAIRARVNDAAYKGICNIFFPDNNYDSTPSIEFILLEQAPPLTQGTKVRLFFHKRLRSFLHFPTPDDLIRQISSDKRQVDELIY
ncbi:MAG TPA: riboflavin kinase [Bacteroidales bacterium]|nr:riboflavin kinase [Bacteroidales bacterium]